MGIGGKEGKKTTKMYVVLNGGDVKLLTFFLYHILSGVDLGK
jgi:hypothetical protein